MIGNTWNGGGRGTESPYVALAWQPATVAMPPQATGHKALNEIVAGAFER